MDKSLKRLEELLVRRSLRGLTEPDARELRALITEYPQVDVDAFDRTAAAIVASQARVIEAMPAKLYERIEAVGVAMVARKRQ